MKLINKKTPFVKILLTPAEYKARGKLRSDYLVAWGKEIDKKYRESGGKGEKKGQK